MTVKTYQEKSVERREERRGEIIFKINLFLSGRKSDKSLSMRKIAKLAGIAAPSLYYYFSSVRDIATALLVDALKDTEDKKIAFFDFYMTNLDEAKFVFDLKNGVRLDQIEWFDNSCKEKLGYIVAKILESDNG